MNDEMALESLRRDVGLEAALTRVVAQPELRSAVEATLTRPEEPPRMHAAAALSGMSSFEFSKSFRDAAGLPFHEFVDRVRVDAALVRLATTLLPAEAIAEELGFIGTETLGLSIAEYTGLPFAAVLTLLRP